MTRILVAGLILGLAAASFAAPDVRSPMAGAAPAQAQSEPVNTPPPIPVSPADGDTVFVTQPRLKVEDVSRLAMYHFRVMEEASVAAEGYSVQPIWVVRGHTGGGLQRGHHYHWSCRVHTGNGWSEWFEPEYRFTISSATRPPRPKRPASGATVTSRPLLAVAPVGIGATYQFRVWCGKTLVAEKSGPLPVWRIGGGGLEPGEMYTWSCRIVADDDTSDWFSPDWWFLVRPAPQGAMAAGGSDPVTEPGRATVFRGRVVVGSAGVTARVYAANGRLVRTIDGRDESVWDGRDSRGVEVPAGAYACVIDGASPRATRRIVKLE